MGSRKLPMRRPFLMGLFSPHEVARALALRLYQIDRLADLLTTGPACASPLGRREIMICPAGKFPVRGPDVLKLAFGSACLTV